MKFADRFNIGLDPKRIHFVDITEITEYYMGLQDAPMNAGDFACLSLPWERAWFEFTFPRQWWDGQQYVDVPKSLRYGGILVYQETVAKEDGQRAVYEEWGVRRIEDQYKGRVKVVRLDNEGHQAPKAAVDRGEECRFIIWYKVAVASHDRMITLETVMGYLDPLGRPLGGDMIIVEAAEGPFNFDPDGPSSGDMLKSVLQPAWFAVSLLHCNNVEIVDQAENRAIRRRRQREGKPDYQFKTLHVQPLKMRRQSRGSQGGTHSSPAFHVRRGHFRDYTEKGLFGKYPGVFWFGPAVVGSRSQGVVDKDYAVDAD